jgi:hypothetical protein
MARAAADPAAVPAPGRAPALDAPAPDAAQPPHCRNCGAAAPGAFCPACGQETALALPTARQFLKEAAGRYVAFDGRMWRTLAALLFRPGHLTREYLAGRRRRYIRPARLFLVLSLVLFFVMRIAIGVPTLSEGIVEIDRSASSQAAAGARAPAADPDAPADPGATGRTGAGGSPRVLLPGLELSFGEDDIVNVAGAGPVAQALKQRMNRFNALPKQERLEQLVLGTLRYGPYAMFVLLPAFAFLLQVVYAGRGGRYPQRPRRYAEHLVFAAHNHAYAFLAATLAVPLPWGPLRFTIFLWSVAYALWSMRAVYGGRWLGLLARAWLLAVAYLVLFAFVTVGLIVAAVVIR